MRFLPLSLLRVFSVDSELKDAAESGGTMYSTHYKPKLKHLQSIGDDNIPATIYFTIPSSAESLGIYQLVFRRHQSFLGSVSRS